MAAPPSVASSLHGRRVRLSPIVPADHEWVYTTAVATEAGHQWRLHGAMPGPDEFFRILFAGAAATFVARRAGSDEPVGVVQVWNLDQLSKTAQLSVFLADEFVQLGWPFESVVLAANHAFLAYDLRKIYLEVLEPQMVGLESLVGWALEREGLLREHRYVMGSYLDCHVLSLTRSRFDEIAQQWSAASAP